MRLRLTALVAGVLAASFAPAALAAPSPAAGNVSMASAPGAGAAAACDTARPGQARCFALVRTARSGRAVVTASPSQGYGPADLQAAYNLPASGGGGQVIAVVDAYDDPSAEADLATYRTSYGLPACTTANGCFSKVNQDGAAGSYPPADEGWAVEISLDLDMVSAACPDCHILLVEANSAAVSDLAAAEDTAAGLGANVISNSYGLPEFNGMQQFFADYAHAGQVIVASSGDFGFTAAQFPAVAPGVLAAGGTRLTRAGTARGWTETAWGNGARSGSLGGSGSGCSAYVAKPAWQHDKYCHMRTIADVSADADPQTGVAVYDSTPNPFGPPGWLVVGGTSASAPFIAGVTGLAGNAATFTPGYAYAHTSSLHDVTKGSNGYCSKSYLCTAKRGYDGPTGLGTPDGTGAF
jgi:subtilase family serine protease